MDASRQHNARTIAEHRPEGFIPRDQQPHYRLSQIPPVKVSDEEFSSMGVSKSFTQSRKERWCLFNHEDISGQPEIPYWDYGLDDYFEFGCAAECLQNSLRALPRVQIEELVAELWRTMTTTFGFRRPDEKSDGYYLKRKDVVDSLQSQLAIFRHFIGNSNPHGELEKDFLRFQQSLPQEKPLEFRARKWGEERGIEFGVFGGGSRDREVQTEPTVVSVSDEKETMPSEQSPFPNSVTPNLRENHDETNPKSHRILPATTMEAHLDFSTPVHTQTRRNLPTPSTTPSASPSAKDGDEIDSTTSGDPHLIFVRAHNARQIASADFLNVWDDIVSGILGRGAESMPCVSSANVAEVRHVGNTGVALRFSDPPNPRDLSVFVSKCKTKAAQAAMSGLFETKSTIGVSKFDLNYSPPISSPKRIVGGDFVSPNRRTNSKTHRRRIFSKERKRLPRSRFFVTPERQSFFIPPHRRNEHNVYYSPPRRNDLLARNDFYYGNDRLDRIERQLHQITAILHQRGYEMFT